MASLKKPDECPLCHRADGLRKIIVDWINPHQEGFICDNCVQDEKSAIFPDAFIISRPKRAKGVCRECGRTPEQVEFKKGKNWCVECAAKYHEHWKFENAEHIKEYRSTPGFKLNRNIAVKKAITRSPEGWLQAILGHISKPTVRNKVGKGHSPAIMIVEIDHRYLVDLYYQQDGRCAITSLKMTHQRHNIYSISIDRINSDVGYIPGNVQLVCKFVNLGKSKHTNFEVIELFNTYYENRRQLESETTDGELELREPVFGGQDRL